ncbi:alpha-L-fucosidase [Pseudactinotalea sp.]|uniref:alpha-L-fucosidase n=1 Tax=Pseudactinotalea sp. TaxID=1926260 RepID=UPI003B3AF82B
MIIESPTAALTTAPRLTEAARPSPAQLAWQREELAMFVHLGINTVTDREWGDGTEDPSIFDPADLNARQWARTAREAGFGTLILTAKHHDGFCLWPTATTTHSVAASPWRGGSGDVVREAAEACASEGIRFGIYCSPWDRNAPSYGTGREYDDLLIAQLTELLTDYGDIAEVWFDGAVGESARGRQRYDWDRIIGTVRELQPGAVIFSDAGPDVRWVGNEDGVAGATCWSGIDPARVPTPGRSDPWTLDSLRHGDPEGAAWRPAETDVSIRPGWFWHESETPLDGGALLDLYLTSVGRNSKLLLNVPPNRDGLLDDADVAALHAFAELREEVFGTDLLAGAAVESDGATLVLTLPEPVTADLVTLAEDIEGGQHIAAFRVQVDDGEPGDAPWRPLTSGTTIGHLRALRIPPTRIRRLRVSIDLAYGPARLTHVGLHHHARGEHRRRADNHD